MDAPPAQQIEVGSDAASVHEEEDASSAVGARTAPAAWSGLVEAMCSLQALELLVDARAVFSKTGAERYEERRGLQPILVPDYASRTEADGFLVGEAELSPLLRFQLPGPRSEPLEASQCGLPVRAVCFADSR